MKQQLIKKTLIPLVSMAIMSYAGISSAHTYTGVLQNKTTQVLTLDCPAGTARLLAQVNDISANPGIMSVTIFKGANAQVASDPSQGGSGFGPFATLVAGSGTYYLVASHTAAINGFYRIQYHCEDANGAETTGAAAILTQP